MNATLGVGVMATSLAQSLSYAIAGSGGMATPGRRADVNAVHSSHGGADVAQGDLGLLQSLNRLIYAADVSRGVLLGAAEGFDAYPALLEIAPQRIHRAGTLGEGDIGVRPDQIERVLREARLGVFRPPREYVKRQAALLAPPLQFGARATIDMDLPNHCLQGLVIVDIAGDDPRQPIAAVNGASPSLVQGAMAIIDHDLRYRPEHESTKGAEFYQHRKYRRRESRADDVGDLSLGRYQHEHPVRGLDQAACESDALGFVAVQQRVGRAARKNRLQFPGEIDRIADAGVHTLSAGGAMDVRGVAEQERAALAEVLRHAMVDAIGREPVDLLDFDLEIVDDPPADVLEFERISMPGAFAPYRADQPRTSFSGQRKHREEVGLLEIDMEFAIERRAAGLDIRHVEQVLVGAARISRAHRLAHNRVRAVASSDVGCLACFFLAVGSAQTRDDAAAFITVAQEFGAPLDRDAQLFERCNQ